MSDQKTILSSTSPDDASKPKRKKTARACNHCHKAHMTCDNSRPCKRCIQRGLLDSCEDAPRKKKKYLMDVPDPFMHTQTKAYTNTPNSVVENAASNLRVNSVENHHNQATNSNLNLDLNSNSNLNNHSTDKPRYASDSQNNNSNKSKSNNNEDEEDDYENEADHDDDYNSHQHSTYSPIKQPQPQLHSLSQPAVSNRRHHSHSKYNFLSSAADMEYSTLSSIIQVSADNSMMSPGFSTDSDMGIPTNHQGRQHSQSKLHPSSNLGPGQGHGYNQSVQPYVSRPSQTPSPSAAYQTPIYTNKPKCDESINQYFLGPTETSKNYSFPDVIAFINSMKEADPATFLENGRKSSLSFTIGIIPEDNSYNSIDQQQLGLKFKEPEEIYAKVKHPFSYTPGYHSLIAYLRQRFPKVMLVKLAKSMAEYRPSFIACTNTLKEEDLIFMEKCFQRTLLTYDNFISVNGTPAIVWRRTGQIAYVGNEFCVLTGWTKDQLLNKTTFIVELLDDDSVVEYFQEFSRIAFGDFRGATMTECTVLTPNPDVKIRAGCSWTLKRDVFGIPMMIIGNFLPILQ